MGHDKLDPERDRQVRRVIVIEGLANVAVLALKLVVGVSTGSLAVLGDALHSLSDVANNAVAWFVVRISSQPPDRDHPYGHRKFETLAVFVLIAASTVALPVVLNLVMGSDAAGTLNSMKTWLTANNNTVMMVLFVVLGSKLLGDGISVVG